jgi:hypothetical protein
MILQRELGVSRSNLGYIFMGFALAAAAKIASAEKRIAADLFRMTKSPQSGLLSSLGR